MKKKHIYNLALLIGSLLIAFIIAEISIRIYYPTTNQIIGIDDEEKCTRDFLKRINNYDPNNLLPLQVSYYEYSNYSGIRPKTNYSEIRYKTGYLNNYGKVILTIHMAQVNSQNILDYYDFTLNKSNKTRIAIFGDSFTFGTNTPFQYSYPYILEKLLPNTEVMNFGIEGIGVDTMYLRWKYEAKKFNPDVVIFTIFIDDVARMRPCIYKPKLNIINGSIIETNFPPPNSQSEFKKYGPKKIESYLIKHVVYFLKNFGGDKRESYNYGFKLLQPIFDEVTEHSKATNTSFLVVIIGSGNKGNVTEFEKRQIERLKDILVNKNISYIGLNEIFEKEKFVPRDYSIEQHVGHFMPKGYAILAQGVKNKLEDLKIVEKEADYNISFGHKGTILLSSLVLENKNNDSDIKYFPVFRIVLKNGSIMDISGLNLSLS